MDVIYTDPKNPGSFGGVRKLAIASGSSQNAAGNYLSGKDSYTLHRKRVRKFWRNKYVFLGVDDLWQSDLADMSNISQHNDNVKYLLITIDCFTKFVWVQNLKSKQSREVAGVIEKFVASSSRKPINWQVDKGFEFQNPLLKKFMKENQINFYSTSNPETKAAFAERAIRTLKSRLYRYFKESNGWRYIEILQDVVDSYNNTVHRSTGMKPSAVTADNSCKIKRRLNPPKTNVKLRFVFDIGDYVRLAKAKRSFEKGYEQAWTEEIFRVRERLKRDPPVYRVEDWAS